MKQSPAIRINKISFVGKDIETAELAFPGALSFIYGASNTGKSFAVKALDFMLGASRELPAIIERRSYSRIQLDLQVTEDNLVIERAIAGGDFQYVAADGTTQVLSARHNRDNETNLSNFLLARLGIAGREIARDKSGTKKPLSFRDIARFCVTDETSIQAETSPIESGDVILTQSERNAFKFLVTGDDDSALITQVKATDFRTGKTAQLRVIEEMIGQIDTEIAEDYPDVEQLDELAEEVADALEQVEADIIAARISVRILLDKKRDLSIQIGVDQQRVADIAVSLDNFEQLQCVYASDIARLEAIEEAGFLFSMDANMDCPVCGAAPDKQVHDHGLVEIDRARTAAEAEIVKIRLHEGELASTMVDTEAELNTTGKRLLVNLAALQTVEKELNAASPNAEDQQRRFIEIIPRRDRIKRGLDLVSRRVDLEKQRVRIEGAKQVKPKGNFQPGLGTQTAQDFADEVGLVLDEWGFPGKRRVVFDLQTYDLIIDGKARSDNGKGVRAITHAAFKVGLLIYCRKRQLPHPGFVVLDSPLITYRDPIRSTLGALDAQESAIRASDLKDRFFAHLGSLGGLGQIVLFDNADPPQDGARFASIETFTNDPTQGRQGLFKVDASDQNTYDRIG